MEQQKLNVMEIERFAVQDGPGIRTTMFLKGCAMHCPWCANPESQPAAPVLLHDAGKCLRCGGCAACCPVGAVRWQPAQLPVFDRARCTACGVCCARCPGGALELCGRQMSAQEIAKIVLRDRDYYRDSGGGVTFSGGEALLQAPALAPLLALLRAQGVALAVETCGQFLPQALKTVQAAGGFDLFLFDVKHADPKTLARVTGGDAGQIIANLDAAVQSGARVIARVPVIPGFNHDRGAMAQIFRLCAAHGVREADLLPYHTLGRGKYARLGRSYDWPGAMLQREDLQPWAALAAEYGVRARIGGGD